MTLTEALARHRTDGVPHTGALVTVPTETWTTDQPGMLPRLEASAGVGYVVVE